MVTLWCWEIHQSALKPDAWNEEFCCLFRGTAISTSYENPKRRTGLRLLVPPVDLSRFLTLRCQQV